MGTLMEKIFGFYPVRKELEARISGLENEKAEEKEKLTREKTALTEKIKL